jgi:hypothetical protein
MLLTFDCEQIVLPVSKTSMRKNEDVSKLPEESRMMSTLGGAACLDRETRDSQRENEPGGETFLSVRVSGASIHAANPKAETRFAQIFLIHGVGNRPVNRGLPPGNARPV